MKLLLIYNFGIEHSEEEIDAVKYPIDVMKLDGRANFVGVFGLTGGFEGVFSNDAARDSNYSANESYSGKRKG